MPARDRGPVRALGEPARRVHRGPPAARAWRRSGSRSIIGAASREPPAVPDRGARRSSAVLAAVTVTVSTPLGAAIWSYLLSFQNQAISLASTEWESAFSDPLAVVYLALATVFAAWMWVQSPRPRRATTLLVTAGFLVFAGLLDPEHRLHRPVLALQVAWTAPNRSPGADADARSRSPARSRPPRRSLWAAILGPAARRSDASASRSPTTRSPIHRSTGASSPTPGVGSYINWRSPDTRGGAERLARALHATGAARQLRGAARRGAGPARRAAAAQGGSGDRARVLRDPGARGGRLPAGVQHAAGDLSGAGPKRR